FANPLVGSQCGRNVFADATTPYGLAKAACDVDGDRTGEFSTDGSNVTGFSIVHDSGTGGIPSLGKFPLFPQVRPGDELKNCMFRIRDRATKHDLNKTVAERGYFSVELASGVKTGMTVAEHAALMRFNFPSAQMVNSMLDIYKREGWLPGCRMSLCKGGSNADVVIVDYYVKNLASILWELALTAITKDAEDEPPDWSYEGRAAASQAAKASTTSHTSISTRSAPAQIQGA
ncbi:glycosyl hydrolase family 92, partial [Colletotrichum orchidophilum]